MYFLRYLAKTLSFLKGRWFIFLYDLVMIPIAWVLVYFFRFNFNIPNHYYWNSILSNLPWLILIQSVSYWIFGLYRGIWRFSSLPDVIRILKAVIVGTFVFGFLLFMAGHATQVPRAVLPLYAIFLTGLLTGSRSLYRWVNDYAWFLRKGARTLIIGAGNAGEMILREMQKDQTRRFKPVAFVDDDRSKIGREILGIRVVGTADDIPALVKELEIKFIIIAIPSAGSKIVRRIVKYCEELNIPFQILPGLNDIVEGRVTIGDLRSVALEDLLGRDPVALDNTKISDEIKKHVILITGGGGSIGSELCRQIAQFNPKLLLVLDNSEFNLYKITQELQQKFPHINMVDLLDDMGDMHIMRRIFDTYHPQVIFHAAAYKHVPMLEDQLFSATKNNVLSVYRLAQLADQYQVDKFILVSTDKAVNPSNVMGMTKRIGEIFCQNFGMQSKTQFITVRFGNVLGSTGSVVPLFQKQLRAGGPLTVTHPEMTRFFMTIPEAASLILQASTMGNGEEIFVLDMGEPVKIQYLAEQIIQLSGSKFKEDIDIIYTGIRPGEKLYEELFHHDEERLETQHQKIFLARSRQRSRDSLKKDFENIQNFYEKHDISLLWKTLKALVPEYIGKAHF